MTVMNGDILKKAPDHILNAREVVDDLEDNQTGLLTCPADIALSGLFTFHGLF